MPRLLAVGVVLVLCLAGGAASVAAQEQAGPVEGVTVEPMFEVELGGAALPEELAGVLVFNKVYPIGMEIAYGEGFVPPNTFVRYVESGQLGVKPYAEMTVIRASGTAPVVEVVPGETEVTVGPGDTFIQSDVPYEEYGSGALGTMWHEGEEDAVTYGFAIRESSRCCSMTHAGMLSPWHDTLVGENLEALIGQPIRVRMERIHLDPGATWPLAADEPATMRLVESGILTATAPGDGDPAARSQEFEAGRSFSDHRLVQDLGFLIGGDLQGPPVLANMGDEPVVLLQLVTDPATATA